MNYKILFGMLLIFIGCADGNESEDNSDEMDKDPPMEEMVAEDAKMVLLEEFSGQDCPNCPSGYRVSEALSKTHGSRYIPVTIHAGSLSRAELRIEEGQKLWDYFKIPYQPYATINRTKTGSGFAYTTSAWPSVVEKELKKTTGVKIELTPTVDERNATVKAKLTFQNAETEPLKFSLYLLEDNITAFQSGSSQQHNHIHVLRDVITNFSGDALSVKSFSAGGTHELEYTFTINAGYKIKDLSLVGFLSRVSDEYVVQAAQKDLINSN